MLVVTGGAGFIGSNLVAALAERGRDSVVVCDDVLDESKRRNLEKHRITGLVEPQHLATFLAENRSEIQAILHLAATSSTTEADTRLLLRNNFFLSARLWDWCTKAGVRFLYASSASTYGDGAQGFDDDASTKYLSQLRPLSPYAWSKHLFDRRVARRVMTRHVPPQWAGLKMFNVYGPNEYHKGAQQSMVAHAFRSVMREGRVRLFRSNHPDYPDGGQKRDFVWVGDCVQVMLWLLENPFASGIFNVGSGSACSFADLAKEVSSAAGRIAQIDFVDMPPELGRQYQNFTQARLNRLRNAGYSLPFLGLREGIQIYTRDYLLCDDQYR